MCTLRSSTLAFAALASLAQSQDPQPSPYVVRQFTDQSVMSWDQGRDLCFDSSDPGVDGMATLDTSTLATSIYSLDEQFDLLRTLCDELTNNDGRGVNCWVAGRLNPAGDGYLFASTDTLREDYSPAQGDPTRWGCVRGSDGVTCEKDIEGTQLDNGEDFVCLFRNRNFFFADWPQNGGTNDDFLVSAVICNNGEFSYNPDGEPTTTTTTTTMTPTKIPTPPMPPTPRPTDKVDPDALCDVAHCDDECECDLLKDKQCNQDLAECLNFLADSIDCFQWGLIDAASRSAFLRVSHPECLELVEQYCCAEEDLDCACDAAPVDSRSPSEGPSDGPTVSPTKAPSLMRSEKPSKAPTPKPTKEKTEKPTKKPSDSGSAKVSCDGDCECPKDVAKCTLSAEGEDSAKDSELNCGSSSVCVVECVGKSSCAGEAEIRGDDVGEEMFVLCEGEDACKGNTRIYCGSVALCSVHCADETSCEDTTVDARNADAFECSGYCDAIEMVSNSESDSDSGDYYVYFDRNTKKESKWD